MTREHLIPASLAALVKRDEDLAHTYLNRSPKKFLESQPTVKDVCNICNNEVLGKLDNEARNFIASYCLEEFNSKGETRTLKINYDLLLRWVMKVSFNSARIHDAEPDREILSSYRSYILGNGKQPKRIAFFVHGIYSHPVDDDQANLVMREGVDNENIIHPDYIRCSLVRFQTDFDRDFVSRAIIFKSFQFTFLLLRKKAPHSDLLALKRDFLSKVKGALEIRRDKETYNVTSKISAFDAIFGHFMMRYEDYGEEYVDFIEKQMREQDDRNGELNGPKL